MIDTKSLHYMLNQSMFVQCPACGKMQRFEYVLDDSLWFPVPSFCCDAMRYGDSPEWNILLDIAIRKALP